MFVTFRFLHVGFIQHQSLSAFLRAGWSRRRPAYLMDVGAPPQPAPVAQWTEHPFPRRLVAGSNPARGTHLTLRR